MREILFRGETIDGQWVCGDFISIKQRDKELCGIRDYTLLRNAHVCDRSTIGQYTGITDKNGKKIFEGDILEAHFDEFFPDSATRVSVAWHGAGFVVKQNDTMWDALLPEDREEWEVIGNIYDNPDLLQEV